MTNLAANILVVIIFVTGLYVPFSQSWNTAYRANIIAHPVLSAAATLLLLGFYLKHARERTGASPIAAARRFTVIVIAASMMSALWPAPFLAVWSLVFAIVFFFTTRRILAGAVPRHFRASTAGWQAVYFLLILSMISGVAVLPLEGVARGRWLFFYHRWVSYATVILFIVFLFVPFFTRAAEHAFRLNAARYWTGARTAFGVCFIAAAILFAGIALERQHKDPVYNASLSTIPLEKRAPEDRFDKHFPLDVANMVQMSESCAANPGCHQQELEDFLISNHNISARTPYFQKNLDELKREIGAENLKLCAGCHYPYMMLSGNLDHKYYMKNNGFSCVYCHVIGSVRKHATDKRITYLTVEPNVAHLKMFYRPGRGPRIGKWEKLLVDLNPTGHARVFKRPLYFEDRYCQVCHELQIKSPKEVGLQRNTCIRCHMQPRYFLGFKGKKMNHYYPGTNTMVPHSLGMDSVVNMVKAWVRGDITNSVPELNFWKLRKKGGERSERAFWLFMNIDPAAEPMPGRDFSFKVITTNTGIDHQFPSAPLDLVEAWLEVIARDATGRVIYHLGGLDKHYRLAAGYPDRHRLGGYMLDSQDHLLIENRVWDIQKKIILRSIMPYQTAKDAIRFRVPDYAAGPITVTARWNYRKHNQDFAEWGLADAHWDARRPKTAPATIVGEVSARFRTQDVPVRAARAR